MRSIKLSENSFLMISGREELPVDEFSDAGPLIGSVLRQIFVGVSLPIADRNEFLSKAGKDRLIYLELPATGTMILSLEDILEAIPTDLKFYPVKSAKETLKKFMLMHNAAMKKREPSFLTRVKSKNLRKIITEPHKEIEPIILPPVAPIPSQSWIPELIKQIRTVEKPTLTMLGIDPEKSTLFWKAMSDYLVEAFKVWEGIWFQTATDRAIADARSAEQAANEAEQAANEAEQAKDNAAADSMSVANNAVALAQQKCATAEAAALRAQNFAASARANATTAGTPQAYNAANQAEAAANRASAAAGRARNARNRAQLLYSIQPAIITVHVKDDDSCSGQDDVGNANVTIISLSFTEVKAKTSATGGNGRVSISGRFGSSSQGAHQIYILAEKGGNEGSTTRMVYGTAASVQITIPGYDA
jgi:hypothetical protein